MKNREQALRALIEGVVALSEATRSLASAGQSEAFDVEELRRCVGAVAQAASLLEDTGEAVVPLGAVTHPPPALPRNEIVESLDGAFGPDDF